ncbi:damage-control phosphatase ARMT1 family protein [Sphaerochaeta sp.]|uniref:damage-control phosphatase ARMT1 family protein n=1 Tax=Sphaerochaeta sp. TaxID=1972642 RepID=UPI003D0992A4
MDEVGDELKNFPLDMPPPVMAYHIQRLITEISGQEDPYREIKAASNRQVLAVIDNLRTMVHTSQNPMLMAVKLACAGNIIDYGAFPNGIDVQAEISKILSQTQTAGEESSPSLFDFDVFMQALSSAKRVMYIGDNAGEIVFDRVLLETIAETFPHIELYFVTREKPILNDVLIKDAMDCGLDSVATVVSSGSKTPGLILSEADPDFLSLYRESDMIISKGQGNYEALSQAEGPVFFLLIIKCEVIMRLIGGARLQLVLKKNSPTE